MMVEHFSILDHFVIKIRNQSFVVMMIHTDEVDG